jgi:agmatinase
VTSELFYPPRTFAAIPPPYAAWETAKVVILPVPYDSTTEYKGGAREGPQAIIAASQYLELYDIELDREVHHVGIHTLPEVEPVLSGPEWMLERVYQATKGLVERGMLVVMLGGEHSLTLGVVKAFRERVQKLSVLQLDAHADLRNEYLGTKYSHACVMRRIWELCPIVPVGIRSLSWEERQFLQEQRIKPFYADDYTQELIPEVLSALSSEVYITIDLDVFDPGVMPAVGTPEPGGLSWQQVLSLLRAVAKEKHIVGCDVVELCPREGLTSCAFLAAKLAYKVIGYATAPSH